LARKSQTPGANGQSLPQGMIDLVTTGDGRVHLALVGHMPYPKTATLSSEEATEIRS